MYLHMHGYNAVAMLGADISQFQVEKILKLFHYLTIVPDGDEPGYAAAKRIAHTLQGRIPLRIADVPKGFDPDQLSFFDLRRLLGEPNALPAAAS
jgi:DNA primase